MQAGERIWECSRIYRPKPGHEDETSNNVAEYAGIMAVLEWFAHEGLFNADITTRGDSALVINQVFGTWKIKKGVYTPLAHIKLVIVIIAAVVADHVDRASKVRA